jgi:hypothetical protein
MAALVAGTLAGGAAATAEEQTWSGVAVVDTMCYGDVKDAPDEHTTECALQCAGGGYGLITAEGEYLRFDAAGNARVVEALEATDLEDGLRATVVGVRKGDRLELSSFQLDAR